VVLVLSIEKEEKNLEKKLLFDIERKSPYITQSHITKEWQNV
jgi:hypothetical protein